MSSLPQPGEEESLGPPIKPPSGDALDAFSFPKSIVLDDGTEVPVGLPPGVDAEQTKLAVAYLKQNPTLAKNAVRRAERLMTTPGMAQQMMQMQNAMMTSEDYKRRMSALRDDPELKSVFDEIEGQGMEAIDKYWNDMELLSKISKRMEEMKIENRAKKPTVKPKNLHEAAKIGDVESMEKFLKKGEDLNKRDARGITPLGIAVGFNRLPTVEFLLKNGADVHLTDREGNTVLHYAAGYGRVESAEMLLKAGADASSQNNEKKTPLDVATINREVRIIEFLNKQQLTEHRPHSDEGI